MPDQQQDQHQVARPVHTHVRRRQHPRPDVWYVSGGGVVECWVSGTDCGVSEGWLRCEGGPGNASFVSPPQLINSYYKVVVVLSVRAWLPVLYLHQTAVTNRRARVRRRHQ